MFRSTRPTSSHAMRGRSARATDTASLRRQTAGAVAAACAMALAGGAAAQGIWPGDPPTDGYRLPGGIEPVVQMRTFYFDQQNPGDKPPNNAWALGGWAGLRTPWIGDFLQGAVNYYGSWKLYGPEGEGGTNILQSDQSSINVLGEAFGAIRVAGQTFTGYRQLVDRPFINPQDSRMVPNTFEAYTLSGTVDAVAYTGGYITKEKTRGSESFRWMSNVSGGTGSQKGVAYAGVTWNFAKDGYVKIDEQYAIDTFNNFYVEGAYPFKLDAASTLVVGGQYYPQSSVGDAQIGSFSTYGWGLQGLHTSGPVGLQLYWQQTGRGANTLNPFGTHAGYVAALTMIATMVTANEKTFGVGANLDFGPLGAPGLKASILYANGRDRITASTGAPLGDENETDIRFDYAFAKGTALEELVATFRYSWLNVSGTGQTTQLRAILNYPLKF